MVDLRKLYEAPAPKPGLTLPTHATTHVAVKTLTAPKRTVVSSKQTKVRVTPPPQIPGHEHAPIKSIAKTATTTHTAAKPKVSAPKPKPKAANPVPKPAPKISKPATKTLPTSAKASSPAPNTGVASSGFDLASFLPILLIAGAVIAGVYLYSHRKGR